MSRRRKKQLGFETLESRQVMSAASLVAPLSSNLQMTAQSYSSSTAEGLAALQNSEMYWQSMIDAISGGADLNSRAIPSDPLFGMQWHLVNTGQQVGSPDWQSIFGTPGEDLNVAPVYNQGITGKGVTVGVIDSGVQLNHPDLAANISTLLAFDALNPFLGDGNPTISLLQPGVAHGTAVAGLIGAVADNGIGGAGVAPGVTLVPIRLIDVGQTNTATVAAFRHALTNSIDITNNSWGPSDALRTLAGPSFDELLALRDTIFFGREGKGIIHVWAAGNGGAPNFARPGVPGIGAYDQSNYDGYANLRYTIAVGAVDHDGGYNNIDGTVTAYPEGGANVLVSAPTGSVFTTVGLDTGTGSGLVTTDLTGQFGFNGAVNPQTGEDIDRDFLADTNYTSRFNGTSAAAPLVAGVVALMLEANPDLTWRDVQEILVRSARQNAQFEIPQIGSGSSTQNTWIINQMPLFHDPDVFVAGVPNALLDQTLRPELDPNALTVGGFYFDGRIVPGHHVATPFVLTNGAGYTVSQGRGVYNEMIGYGHGVVDAALAVSMAQQWTAKDQMLPSELSFTTFINGQGNTPLNIPAAERGSQASSFQIVPGGIGGAVGGGFINYWNEYFVTDHVPFSLPNPPTNTRGGSLGFSVPDSNMMSVESVDIKLSITGNPDEILNHLRIMLVSPDGTHSELNNNFIDVPPIPSTFQWLPLTEAVPVIGTPAVGGSGLTQFVWTFNTNRIWGERSDDSLVIDPVTQEPVIDALGLFGGVNSLPGQALKQGWQLVMENWDLNDAFGLASAEIVWHGSPIAATSRRVQGFVGVDDNHDGDFNYSRVITTIGDNDGDPTTVRLGDVVNDIDLTQESFGANATVTVRRTADNSLVDQFVTGHDGNFYFDLVPDDYTITVEDTAGKNALDDTTTPAQFLRHYRNEWKITSDWFKAWDHDAIQTGEVLIDQATGTPVSWLDGNLQAQESGMRGINFLLDPGPAAAPQATFQGVVQTDTNGDGVFNPDDVALPGVTVFGDLNRNGVRDPGEATAITNAQGQYTLVMPLTSASVVNVGVQRPTGWTSTNDGPGTADVKTDGLEAFFVQPGVTVSNVNFSIKPPATNNAGGGGATQPGYLTGVVFVDANGDGVRQSTEGGAAGFRVYIDANNSGTFDAGDTQTTTNQFGAWAFGNVQPGQRIVRLEAPSPFVQTAPSNNGARVVTLVGSSTISGLQFGVRNTAILDYGDLPANYPVASHKVGAYRLGAAIDAELASNPSTGADGDDIFGLPDDEDGVEFVTPFTPGTNATIKVTANRNNGYLQGWADWNNDGDFNDAGERIITNRLLQVDANQNFINFAVPANASPQVYLRFRYGEFATGSNAISTPGGQALTGEVEDYLKSVPVLPAVIAGTPADFNQDTKVDGFDFMAWQRGFGISTGATQAQGNSNSDGAVNASDLNAWKASYGATVAASAATTANADFNGDQAVDGFDFLALQRNLGATSGASSTAGDGNGDGAVNAADLTLWGMSFGYNSSVFNAGAGSGSATSKMAGLGSLQLADAASQWVRTAEATPTRAPGRRTDLELTDLGGLLASPLSESGDLVQTLIAGAGSEVLPDYNFWRRDRAFDDLLGSRRRQNFLAEADDAGAEGTLDECDEAFAALADHLQWKLG